VPPFAIGFVLRDRALKGASVFWTATDAFVILDLVIRLTVANVEDEAGPFLGT